MAGSDGNQPKPWLDPQGTRDGREGRNVAPLLPRLSTTGRASVGPWDRLKVQSSPRLTAGPRVIPLGGTSAGPRSTSGPGAVERKVAKCLVI